MSLAVFAAEDLVGSEVDVVCETHGGWWLLLKLMDAQLGGGRKLMACKLEGSGNRGKEGEPPQFQMTRSSSVKEDKRQQPVLVPRPEVAPRDPAPVCSSLLFVCPALEDVEPAPTNTLDVSGGL